MNALLKMFKGLQSKMKKALAKAGALLEVVAEIVGEIEDLDFD